MTQKGRDVMAAIDSAREKMLISALSAWNKKDMKQLARMLRRFADDAVAWAGEQPDAPDAGRATVTPK